MEYKDLNIHEKINYRSGWDIAIAYESNQYNRFRESIKACGNNLKQCCTQPYDIDRFIISLRTRLK